MMKDTDLAVIRKLAALYGVRRVLLFGSAADPVREGRDIDLAVEGVSPRRFFDLYADLLFSLSKPVDVVDLADDTLFTRLVRRDGIPIYG